MDNEQKGEQLLAEANAKIKSSQSFFGAMFGKVQKQEDACELLVRAANAFKMAKKWSAAGDAFCQAAVLHLELQSRHEAASKYVDAGNCYKKSDSQMAISSIQRAIEIYIDMGKFAMAAKYHMNVAEIYENDLIDFEKAMENYTKAADYYKGEESNSSANKCLLKVAYYAAQQEDYTTATKIYEEVASAAMESSLLKYSAKDYLFKAALCHMCVDIQNAVIAVQKYEELYAAFPDTREYKLLQKLFEAGDEQNADAFAEAVKEYDSISRLDQWYTTILLRIKKSISGDSDLK